MAAKGTCYYFMLLYLAANLPVRWSCQRNPSDRSSSSLFPSLSSTLCACRIWELILNASSTTGRRSVKRTKDRFEREHSNRRLAPFQPCLLSGNVTYSRTAPLQRAASPSPSPSPTTDLSFPLPSSINSLQLQLLPSLTKLIIATHHAFPYISFHSSAGVDR